MRNREFLVDVYNDTMRRVESGEYGSKIESEKCVIKKIKMDEKIKKPGITTVQNDDCINAALKLSNEGKTCLLNMASYKKPGGGVKTGAMAQEEELARRSNLMCGIDNRDFYPLDMNEYIYSENVTFFKDKDYNLMNPFTCDVITIASVNLNSKEAPDDYIDIMTNKISTILYVPYKHGCKNIVLSAFGCGVFKNDPLFVSSLFKKLLDSGYSSLYNKVVFAILNDRNSVSNNYEIFNKIL